ncbi:MAG: hypothetical protein ACYST6_12955 [Planctomycetota bacterium]|jgi:hypothetical protein
MNRRDEDNIIRGYIRSRIKERGTGYALRVMQDNDFLESELQDIKEILAYEKGIEFEDE